MKKRMISSFISMAMAVAVLSSGNVVYAAPVEELSTLEEGSDELTDIDTDIESDTDADTYSDINISEDLDDESTSVDDPVSAPGDDLEENGIYGFVNPDGITCTISGCSNELTTLNLPSTLCGYAVTEIDSTAFDYKSNFKGTLTIPASVKKIGEKAFYECTGFTKLVFASGSVLTQIDRAAFYGCTGLKGELLLPNTVTSIGDQAFGKDSGLSGNLKLPSKIEKLGDRIFSDPSKFTGTLTIPASVKSASDSALDGLYGINTFINKSSCKFYAVYVISPDDAYGALISSDGKKKISRSGGAIEKGTYYRMYAKLDKPKISSVTNAKDGVALKWVKSDGANSYIVKRNGLKKEIELKNVNSYKDKKAENGKTYTYKIKAFNKLTKSESGWLSVKDVFLEKPKKPEVNNSKKGKLTVKWKKNNKCGGYEIQYSLDSKFKDAVTKSVSKSKTSYTISNLKKNKNYHIRVRSYKKASGKKYYSAWSDKVSKKAK